MLSRRLILPMTVALIGLVMAAEADGEAAFSISAEAFRRLSPADQKTLVANALEHRLQHAENLSYEALQRGRIHEYRNGTVGDKQVDLNGRRDRHWRLGNSFRMDTDRGGVDVSDPNEFQVSGFDPAAGVGRSTIRLSETDRTFGRIDAEPNPIVETNRYQYWLDGEHTSSGEYLIRDLVDHRDRFAIEVPEGQDKVQLTVPWQPRWSDSPVGTRAVVLDPRKGFLPIQGKGRWETKKSDGKLAWRVEEFVVEASRLVGDVWMPTKLRELIGGSPLGEGKIAVWEIEVESLEAGTVTPEDLVVPFPEGMEIVDAIKGVSYTVGQDG